MNNAEKFIDAVKNGYLKFIDWKVEHPHWSLWVGVSLFVLYVAVRK